MTADDARLGRDVRRRFQRPGPRVRSRPPLIGSLAAGSTRFAAGTRRPLPIRRALTAAAPVGARQVETEVRPPRWWRPRENVEPAAPLDSLAPRGLARIVTGVPDETSWRPGTISARVAPRTVPMRTPAEVRAAGPMLTSQDTRRRSSPGRPPGKPAGAGRQPPAPAAAAAPPDVAGQDGGARRTRTGTSTLGDQATPGRRGSGLGRVADLAGTNSGHTRSAGPVTPPRVSQLLRRRALVKASLVPATPATTRPRVPTWRRTHSTALAPAATAAPSTRRSTRATGLAASGTTAGPAAPDRPELSAAVPPLRRALGASVPVSASATRAAAVRGAAGTPRRPDDVASISGPRAGHAGAGQTGRQARTGGADGDIGEGTVGGAPGGHSNRTGMTPPPAGNSTASSRVNSGTAAPGSGSSAIPAISPAAAGLRRSGVSGGAASAMQPAAPAGRPGQDGTGGSPAPVPSRPSFPIAAAPLGMGRTLGADVSQVGPPAAGRVLGLSSATAGGPATPAGELNSGALGGAGPVRLRRLLAPGGPSRRGAGGRLPMGSATPLRALGALRSGATPADEPVGAAVAGRGAVRPLGYRRGPERADSGQVQQADSVGSSGTRSSFGAAATTTSRAAGAATQEGTVPSHATTGQVSGRTPTAFGDRAPVRRSARGRRSHRSGLGIAGSGTGPSTPAARLGRGVLAAMALGPAGLPVRGGLLRRRHRVTPLGVRDGAGVHVASAGLGIAPPALAGGRSAAGLAPRQAPTGTRTTPVIGPRPRIVSPPVPVHSGAAAIGSPPAGTKQAPVRRLAGDGAGLHDPAGPAVHGRNPESDTGRSAVRTGRRPSAGLAVVPPPTAAPRMVRRLLAGTPPARPIPPPAAPTAPPTAADQRRPRTMAALVAAESSGGGPTGPTVPGQEGEALTVFQAQQGPAPTGAPPAPASAFAFRREELEDSARQLEELVDLVADRVEDRMRTRQERRGHRTTPGIF